MNLQTVLLTLAMSVAGLSGQAFGAEPQTQTPCAAKLKSSQEGKALADVKLTEEYERSDAQVYLMRLELSVTKQKLAAALAKCGEACQVVKP